MSFDIKDPVQHAEAHGVSCQCQEPAFPLKFEGKTGELVQSGLFAGEEMWGPKIAAGLTKREHFAGLAMQGICSSPEHPRYGEWNHNEIVTNAVNLADALLMELSK